MSEKRRFIVREIPWLTGSRRRTIDRFRYFHEACRVAEAMSMEGRQMIVECHHVALAAWLNGDRVSN